MSSYNKNFITLAREQRMFMALIEHIHAEFLPTDVSETPKNTVACPQLPPELGIVSKDDWLAMVAHLGRAAHNRERDLAKYQHVNTQTTYEQAEETEPVIASAEEPQQANGNAGRQKDRRGGSKKPR